MGVLILKHDDKLDSLLVKDLSNSNLFFLEVNREYDKYTVEYSFIKKE
ncbi:MAG: hypothetical protein ACI8ZX_003098 [Planctomycetota bacterium]|jgi:hypothetical protein